MERAKLVLRLNFKESLRPWLELRALLRAAEAAETTEIQGQTLVTVRQAARERIITQVRAVTVEEEREGFEAVGTRLEAMNAVSPFPEIASLRMDVAAIEPYDLPFHELVSLIRARFWAPNALTEGATDLQLVFDEQTSDTVTEHVQVGPMGAGQLNDQLLVFRREDLPPQFLYVNIGRTVTGPFSYSADVLRGAHEGFLTWAEARAASISEQLRG